MKRILIKFLPLTILLSMVIFLPSFVFAQLETLPIDKDIIIKPLPVNESTLINQKTIPEIILKEDGTTIDKGLIKIYSYKTDLIEEEEPNEIISLRTPNSKTFNLGNKLAKKIYTSDIQILDNNEWYKVEIATSTLEEFDSLTATTKISLFFKRIKTFFINSAYALTGTYFSNSSDGYITGTANSSWSTVYSASNGSAINDTNDNAGALTTISSSNLYNIYRAGEMFDLTDINEKISISSASIFLYGRPLGQNLDNDGNDYIVATSFSPGSDSSIAISDYNTFGTTAFSNTIDLTTINTSGYNEFILNNDGINNISTTTVSVFGFREGHDMLNSPITKSGSYATNSFYWSTAEYTGTTQDPYLYFEYTIIETATTTATSTIQFSASPDELDLIDDIGIITGLTYHFETSTTTADWYEKHYFRWIGVYIIFFGTMFFIIGNRILLELIIRWRK